MNSNEMMLLGFVVFVAVATLWTYARWKKRKEMEAKMRSIW
jgi:hypothetical protein